ncbi:MAG: hypothetical protein ABSG41_07815 [Bryobacteraceae bacterium]
MLAGEFSIRESSPDDLAHGDHKTVAVVPEVRAFIVNEITRLLAIREFLDALPALILPDEANQARLRIILNRLHGIARLDPKSGDWTRR